MHRSNNLLIKIINIPKDIKHMITNPIQKIEKVVHHDQFSNKLSNFSMIKLHYK